MSGAWSQFVPLPSAEEKKTERRKLWHSLIVMLLVLYVGFVPALVSIWQTFDCDHATNVCRSTVRFLGIPTSSHTFPASSLRGTRLIDQPSHDRGGLHHHWDIVVVTTAQEWPLWADFDDAQDDELQRELRDIKAFISGAAPHYAFVSINGLNLVALFFLLLVGWAAVRAVKLGVRIYRLK